MISRSRRTRAPESTPAVVEPVLEQALPVIEQAPATPEQVTPFEATEQAALVLAIPSMGPVAKLVTKKRYVRKDQDPRFAPESVLVPTHLIASFIPNPKRKGSLSADRYGRFYQPNLTVQAYIDAYVAAGLSDTLAKDDLRWDLAHGFITLAEPAPVVVEAPAETPVEAPAPVTE